MSIKITDDNLLTNQVYYQNAKSVDPDSLSSVSFTDTLCYLPVHIV